MRPLLMVNKTPGPCLTELRLGHTLRALHPSLHNGPGWRIGLWTQGCSLRCTSRCLNPQLLSPDHGYMFSIAAIQDAVMNVARCSPQSIEGLTALGGEPTDQAEA